MNANKVCILGGTGFVGQHLAAALQERHADIIILTRNREKHRQLQVLPQVTLLEADIYNSQSLQQHFNGCDVVINLVGILNESGHDGHGFRQAHVELTRKVMDACQKSGVKRLLHMSALNADAAHGPSFYLRTKGEAEDYIHTFSREIAVTSFRPSVIFGPGDSFFNRFAQLLKFAPCLPLACPNARFAPIYIGDLVKQFIDAINATETFGCRLNLCGPEIYTLQELVKYTASTLKIKRAIIGIPNFLALIQAFFMDYLIPTKPFSLDNYDSLKVDSICDGAANKTLTGSTSIKTIVPLYLGHKDQRSRYSEYRQLAHRDDV